MPPIVYLLSLTLFALTTSEFMVASMMPALASALSVAVSDIGTLISLYAGGMVIGGPLLTLLILHRGVPNRRALLALLACYAIAQALAAQADSYAVMAVARVVTGVAASACFGIALAICAEVVSPERRGRASSLVFAGLMLATVLGMPLTTMIEQWLGWRASFWSVTGVTVACALAIARFAPAGHPPAPTSLRQELAEFRKPALWAAYGTSALIIGATFAGFSYFAPILTEVTGFRQADLPWLLAMYGGATVVGNLVAGRLADRHTYPVLMAGMALLTLAMATFALNATSSWMSLAMVIVIGLTGIPMNPAMIARVMAIALPGPLVNTVHTSVINIGLGMGAWLGGAAISAGWGWQSPLWVGALLGAAGLASVLPFVGKPRGLECAPELSPVTVSKPR
ncbi:MAG: MFS transporter [Pseudomonadales bacterium]|nr:MFS transporter [Pseudomonadales bacterium]